MRVTVIGAGVCGLTCALELAERGAIVEVLERAEQMGSASCSWFAGGMLSPWCERSVCDPIVATLGAGSIEWWRRRFPNTVRNGSLVVAQGRDISQLVEFARRTAQFEWLDETQLATVEPDLAGRFKKALFFRDEGHLDPRTVLVELTARLRELGAQIRFGVNVTPELKLRADHVVDCRGLAARDALADLRGVKGEMMLVRTREISLSRPVRILHPRIPMYVVPRAEGLFMVGATTIETDAPTRVSVRSMMELLGAAWSLHPVFGEAEIIEADAGLRPAFPDNLPKIRHRAGRFYVNGCYRHGYLLAPSLARMTAEAVLHGRYFPEVM